MTTKHIVLCDDTIKIVITPKLEKILGRSPATALQQLHFCLESNENNGKIHEDRRWIYNTYEEWQEKFIPTYSTKTIQDAFLTLEKLGVVSSCQLEKKYGNRRKSYTINYDVLDKLIDAYDVKYPPQKRQTNISSPKITSNDIKYQPFQQITSDKGFKIVAEVDDIKRKWVNNSSTIQSDCSNKASQMIDIWNEKIGKDLAQHITSFPKLLNTLSALLKNYFSDDIEEWKKYCHKIASSKFLMGEVKEYRIRFSYAVSENGVNEILFGDKFTFGDRVTTKTIESQARKHINPFENHQESKQALKLREYIKKKITSNAVYESWFKPIYIHYNAETNEYILFAPTRFIRDRVQIMDREIAEKFVEFHFFNGKLPEEYFGTPISHENTLREGGNTTHDISSKNVHILEDVETLEVCVNALDDPSEEDILHIKSTEPVLCTPDLLDNEPTEISQHISREGRYTLTPLEETEKAQSLRHILKEKMTPDHYKTYFKNTYILIDDNDKSFLFIKHDSCREPIDTILKNMDIVFSEISVPPEFFYTAYFGNVTSNEEAFSMVQIQEEQICSSTQDTMNISRSPYVVKCGDDHHKRLPRLPQKRMLLTKTPTDTTSDILSLHATRTQARSVLYTKRKKSKKHLSSFVFRNKYIEFIEHKAKQAHSLSNKAISDLLLKNVIMKKQALSPSHYYLETFNHNKNLSHDRYVTKCGDGHHKIRQRSPQNATFLTKTYSETTSNIFSFSATSILPRNAQHMKKRKQRNFFKKIEQPYPSHFHRKEDLEFIKICKPNTLHSKRSNLF